jgi:hypothetical protein
MTELDLTYEDWHAIHDHMGKSLHIYGSCTVPGGGFAVGIESREKQGFNPRMLMLNFRITATGESPSDQTVDLKQPWIEEGIDYNEVGFVLVGGFSAPAPPTLPIEDVY